MAKCSRETFTDRFCNSNQLLCSETLNDMKYNPSNHIHQDAEVKKLEDITIFFFLNH